MGIGMPAYDRLVSQGMAKLLLFSHNHICTLHSPRCTERKISTGRGFGTNKKALEQRLTVILQNYKEGNKSALFRSGANDEFKERLWEMLGKISEAKSAIQEEAQSHRDVKRKKEDMQAKKKQRAVSDVLGAVAGNAPPAPITVTPPRDSAGSATPPRTPAQSPPTTMSSPRNPTASTAAGVDAGALEGLEVPQRKRGKYTSHQSSAAVDFTAIMESQEQQAAEMMSALTASSDRASKSMETVMSAMLQTLKDGRAQEAERRAQEDERRSREQEEQRSFFLKLFEMMKK